jgi:hypothetical protein
MLISSHAGAADTENGRYQAISIPASHGSVQILFLDTKDGDLWRFWQTVNVSEGLIYIGKIRPGAQPGEVVFSATAK